MHLTIYTSSLLTHVFFLPFTPPLMTTLSFRALSEHRKQMLAQGAWFFSYIIYKPNNKSPSLLASAGTLRASDYSGHCASCYIQWPRSKEVCLLLFCSETSDCSLTFPFPSSPVFQAAICRNIWFSKKDIRLECVEGCIQIHHCWRHLYG